MGFAGQAFASSQVERCDGSSTDLAATGAVCCQVCLRCVSAKRKCQVLRMSWIRVSKRDLQRIEVQPEVLAGHRTTVPGGSFQVSRSRRCALQLTTSSS